MPSARASRAAIVQAPRILPRMIQLPRALRQGKEQNFVFLSSVLHEHASELFAGMSVRGCYQFRVTRNSDLFVDEEEVKNLRTALQGELPLRNLGAAVRLEVADNCTQAMAEFLLQQTELGAEDLYQVNGPVNLVRLMQIPELVDRPDLQFPAVSPGPPCGSGKAGRYFRRSAQGRRAAAPSVPVVHAGGQFHPGGGQGSAGGRDQADCLSHRHRLRHHGSPDRGCRQRQGGDGGGGTDGALRGGSQHQLGAAAGGGRRARGLRRGRAQDPRQDGAGGAARGRQAAPLRAPGHRQLPPAHRAPVHRFRPVHLQRRRLRRRQRGVQAADRPGQGGHCCTTCGRRRSRCTRT